MYRWTGLVRFIHPVCSGPLCVCVVCPGFAVSCTGRSRYLVRHERSSNPIRVNPFHGTPHHGYGPGVRAIGSARFIGVSIMKCPPVRAWRRGRWIRSGSDLACFFLLRRTAPFGSNSESNEARLTAIRPHFVRLYHPPRGIYRSGGGI